tara:strand:+ start:121601 stop:122557 length:957 start_codon:yes stop_codon:yes gene_type:complete
MLKKHLTRYAFSATIIIAVMATWMVADYVHETEQKEIVAATAPATVKVVVKQTEPLPVVEEEPIVEEPVKINAAAFGKQPDDIPTIDELDAIGYVYGLPGKVLMGMSFKETHQDNTRVSHAGAQGMFQIRPRTAALLEVENVMDNYESADAAARYLEHLHQRLFKKPLVEFTEYTLRIVLAAYNAGPNRLRKVGKVYMTPNFEETIEYVEDIIGYYNGTRYYVRKGDTIWQIAEKYNLPTSYFMRVNGLRIIQLANGHSTTNLKYGEFLNVSESVYTINKGDTLYAIAKRLSTTVDHLVAKNKIADPSKIHVGQQLII